VISFIIFGNERALVFIPLILLAVAIYKSYQKIAGKGEYENTGYSDNSSDSNSRYQAMTERCANCDWFVFGKCLRYNHEPFVNPNGTCDKWRMKL